MEMGFLLYLGNEPEIASRVLSSLGKYTWKSAFEVFFSLEKLIERLLRIPIDCDAVVAVADREELGLLGATWNRLLPPKLILVLNEWDEETMKMAFHLSPSFLASLGDELRDVCLVLERIEDNRSKKKEQEQHNARPEIAGSR
jgi:hypothetical protein